MSLFEKIYDDLKGCLWIVVLIVFVIYASLFNAFAEHLGMTGAAALSTFAVGGIIAMLLRRWGAVFLIAGIMLLLYLTRGCGMFKPEP